MMSALFGASRFDMCLHQLARNKNLGGQLDSFSALYTGVHVL